VARVFGEVEGVPEGIVFENRAALHAAGVHRNLQAGIVGSSLEGAESIVLSGGYEDDSDEGDVIVYTGHGGNDPSTKKQVADQVLKQGNLALVVSMQEGIPVRVIRGSRHDSPHAPPAGYRYDGLYRVEQAWHDTGKSGFNIWRFRLHKINNLMPSIVAEKRACYGTPEKRSVTISRIIRSTPTAIKAKQIHDFTCQVCGERLETPVGPYAEAAHIRPLGEPHNGPDTLDNILCLCPNHHALFDLGAFTIEDDLTISGTRNSLRTAKGHILNSNHIRYHRQHFGITVEQVGE
jgi:putative restriction endonuclease